MATSWSWAYMCDFQQGLLHHEREFVRQARIWNLACRCEGNTNSCMSGRDKKWREFMRYILSEWHTYFAYTTAALSEISRHSRPSLTHCNAFKWPWPWSIQGELEILSHPRVRGWYLPVLVFQWLPILLQTLGNFSKTLTPLVKPIFQISHLYNNTTLLCVHMGQL